MGKPLVSRNRKSPKGNSEIIIKTEMIITNLKTKVLLSLLIFLSGMANAQTQDKARDVPQETKERLHAIYASNEFSPKSFHANWHPESSSYLILESAGKVLANNDVQSGERTEIIDVPGLISKGATETLQIENYIFSSNAKKIFLQLRCQDIDTRKTEHWMLYLQTGKLEKVNAGRNNSISPDGNSILFSDKGNLFVYNIPGEKTVQLTNDAKENTISNNGAIWSPDGSRVAFVQSDASEVRLRSALVPGDPSYPGVKETKFARVGGAITKLRVGVVDTKGTEIRWLSVPAPTEGFYLGEVSWAGNSNEVLVEKLSRFRDKREFLLAKVDNGTISCIFQDSDPDWVVASYNKNIGLEWINNYNDFVVISEKDGWRHAYLGSRNSPNQKMLTPGEFDIIDRVGVDEANGWFYYNASPNNGTQKYLYRVRLDGKGKPEQLSPSDQAGTHTYNLSPNKKWAFHTYSSGSTPPVTELVQLADHKLVRVLEDNSELREKIEALDVQPKEFLQLDIGNGIVMDAWMIKLHDFDSTKKYPVFVYVYGEPHGQTVIDSWGHAYTDYHRVIADLGYLVVSMDNRGTPCPKGAAWRRAVAGSLGPLSTEEQAAGIKELGRTRPYVDLTRVGIWGWSGGGSNTLNAMFRKPDVYDVGIAVAPKPQPHLYNAWFQEIYMNTREVNPEGYEKSAPINFAEGLEGDLLIIHGSGETNTHIQITEGLVDKLIELDKQFDYQVYPNRDHGIRKGKGTALHLRTHIARYLLRHLPPGPR